MKDTSIQVIATLETHELIRLKTECPQCHGTLFRLFPDGKMDCSNCKSPILNSGVKIETA